MWEFKTQAAAWGGNGPLKNGVWNVRDAALLLQAQDTAPYMEQKDLRLPAEKANVIQLRVSAASSRKCQLWFCTGYLPVPSLQKMVEFELKSESTMEEYTLDLKNIATWQDQVSSLRFVFVGAKAGDEIQVLIGKGMPDGERSRSPCSSQSHTLGQKPVVREFRLGSLFNDQMVLQRDKPLVPGHALPDEAVTVEFGQQRKIAVANSKGKWEVTLGTQCLPVMSPKNCGERFNVDGHRVELSDILVGDVWLCGGQSNMGEEVRLKIQFPIPSNKMIGNRLPRFRSGLIGVSIGTRLLLNDASDASFPWRPMVGKSRGPSAVAYFFGQALHSTQKVPVGLVCAIKAAVRSSSGWIPPRFTRFFLMLN
jgi:hypothetical protein